MHFPLSRQNDLTNILGYVDSLHVAKHRFNFVHLT